MSEHKITVGGKELTATISPHERYKNLVVAQCVEHDVASQGETEEKALANLTEALELFFEPDES